MLRILDGARQPLPNQVRVLLRVRDGDQREISFPSNLPNAVRLKVPFNDNFRDRYTVIACSDGYRDAGMSVLVKQGADAQLDLMMIRKNPQYAFFSWEDLKARYPKSAAYLSCGIDDSTAKAQYELCKSSKPGSLACLLNLTCSMESIDLEGKSPLDYFRRILWDDTMAQDRFFAYADPSLVVAVRAAASRGEFAEEPDPKMFHPDATCSYKQIQFDVANVQLTFHENATEIINGVTCIKVEPDIDYYKDLLAHGLLEVLPNKITGGLTNPTVVYAMRSTTALDENGPVFDPGYTVV